MSDRGGHHPPEPPYLSQEEVHRLWAKWRAGEVIRCARDEHGIALAVDGAAKTYRLVCTKCGLASPWFGTTPTGLVFRSIGSPVRAGDDE